MKEKRFDMIRQLSFIPSIDIAIELLSYLPKQLYQSNLNQVISAIRNTYNESESIEILSRFDINKNQLLFLFANRDRKTHFSYIIFYAKKCGYMSKKSFKTLYQDVLTMNDTDQNFQLNDLNSIYKYNDRPYIELLNMFLEIGYEQHEAKKLIYAYFPHLESKFERCYAIAINEYCNSELDLFVNKFITLDEIIYHISQEHTFICSLLEQSIQHRNDKDFLFSELFVIEVNNGMTIDETLNISFSKYALLLYTHKDHTPNFHKFTMLFHIPNVIRSVNEYIRFVDDIRHFYNGGTDNLKPLNVNYGNSNSIIFNNVTGELSEYIDGDCIL